MPTLADLVTRGALAASMSATRHGAARRFQAATREPMVEHHRLLRHILTRHAETAFGREHGFAAIAGIDGFRSRIPVTSYAHLKPYIDRQRDTTERCLTRDRPVFYARTSGTTGEPKLLPITRCGLDRLSRIERLVALAQFDGSSLFEGRVLAMVSPAIEGRFDNGLAYGSATGRIYAAMPALIRSKYVVPPELFSVKDYEAKYHAIAALGMSDGGITGLAAANPSTFRKLIEVMRQHWGSLVDDIAVGRCGMQDDLSPAQRAAFLRRFRAAPERARTLAALDRGGRDIRLADIWPRLGGIVTWTGGSCGFSLGSLVEQWPERARIIDAGYCASEFWGTINVDVRHGLCVPTIADAFFEFVERGDHEASSDRFCTLEELEEGRQYYVFVTTAWGLYRYDMNDIIVVTGRYNATPTLAFVQKGRGVTSITGEKLYESQLTEALARVRADGRALPFFVALADEEASEYQVYIEFPSLEHGSVDGVASEIDRRLAEISLEYRDKRASGRLKPLRAFRVQPGTGDLYRKDCVARGQSDAQFKVQRLQYRRECKFDFAAHALAEA